MQVHSNTLMKKYKAKYQIALLPYLLRRQDTSLGERSIFLVKEKADNLTLKNPLAFTATVLLTMHTYFNKIVIQVQLLEIVIKLELDQVKSTNYAQNEKSIAMLNGFGVCLQVLILGLEMLASSIFLHLENVMGCLSLKVVLIVSKHRQTKDTHI